MPIKPENKHLYPPNWPEISKFIRFQRAGGKCEQCGLPNYAHVNKHTRELCLPDEPDAIQIILTVAHLDHDPRNNDYANLKAMCQRCHNRYDIGHRKQTRLLEKYKGMDSLFEKNTIK